MSSHAGIALPSPRLPRRLAGPVGRLAALAGANSAFAVVLAVASGLRLATAIAYRPGLMYSDSWGYVSMAYGRFPVAVAPLRPSGYPLALRILSAFGRDVETITAVQHLAGLGSGLLAYSLLLRLGVRRAVACAAAAVVLLDAYAIALEQYVLAEALFTLAVAAVAYLSLTGRPGAARLSGAGLVLAYAATMRPIALFAVPVWLAHLAWLRPRRRAAVAACAAVIVPLVAYAAVHSSVTGTFGLTQSDGWFLYGRVAAIAHCPAAEVPAAQRGLCPLSAPDRRRDPSWFVFSRHSPAHRELGRFSAPAAGRGASNNALLLDFSRRVIEREPGVYARLVARDFLRYFTPGSSLTRASDDRTLELPARPVLRWDDPKARRRYLPAFEPHALPPARALHAYGRAIHVPRPLMALCALAAAAALALSLAGRAGIARRRGRELFLLLGCALAMLLGSAASVGFALRYLIPAVPLLVCAGALAAGELAGATRRRRAAAPLTSR